MDVHDVVGFVVAVVGRLGLTLARSEREELEAEGLAILYQLAVDWNGQGTFYGYASSLIDKRLTSAWHELAGHSRREMPVTKLPQEPVTKLPELLVRHICVVCGGPVEQAWTGRPRRTCTDRCRQRLSRNGAKTNTGPPVRSPKRTVVVQGERRRVWVNPTVSLDAELQRPSFSEQGLRRMTEFRRVPVAA